jgi:mannitol-1-phosphate 5-dehydrogenase
MEVFHFGAGSIGRGFIGKILSENSYNVTFIDVNKDIIDRLNKDKEYTVETVGSNNKTEVVKNVSGILSADLEAIKSKASDTDLITTAVGANVLEIIAPTVAEIIKTRKNSGITRYINIIACENKLEASTFLKSKVEKYLDEDEKNYMETYAGFVNSAVDRLIPPRKVEGKEVTYTIVEDFNEWIADETLIKGDLELEGMIKKKELTPYIERKLFTVNTGHIIAAHMGVYTGYETIDQAVCDEKIRKIVTGAMEESGAVLIKRYGFNKDEHEKYIQKILKRFENKYLGDSTVRVGREPLRKLGVRERLIRPLLGTLEYGLSNENLLTGISYALKYDIASDKESVELQKLLKTKGVEETLREVTENSIPDELLKIIKSNYEKL